MTKNHRACTIVQTALLACAVITSYVKAGERRVDYLRDIRPILASRCYHCHGPDASQREATLRLDRQAGAFGELPSGSRAFVPGDPRQSEALRRITSSAPDIRMPPDEPLTGKEIGLLHAWVRQGSAWQSHWAFERPRRSPPPDVEDFTWPHNAIDRYILSHLEQQGLTPSPEADLPVLLRRVTFDLTGLPPRPERIDEVLADPSPDRYEKYVDRLLASPHYGPRMASLWLDAARYADTNGFQHDNARQMWPWRDWVVRALNDNLPFDQFTVEQLAGDLLPDPTQQQLLATGFHRNHELNFEGGSIAEESRIGYVVDRTNTTATVWLGLTLGCARCHDHKYDPISQRDYYRLFAFFNNVPERGFAGDKGNAQPTVPIAWPEHDRQVQALRREWQLWDERIRYLESKRDDRQIAWESDVLSGRVQLPGPPPDAIVQCSFDGDLGFRGVLHGNGQRVPGKVGQAMQFDGNTRIDLGDVAAFERDDAFSFGCWVFADSDHASPFLARAHFHGYDLCWEHGHIQAHLVNRWDINAIFVKTKDRFPTGRWHHVMVTYNGSSRADGATIYVNGEPREVEVPKDNLSGTIRTESTLHLGARNAETEGRFRGSLDEVAIFPRELTRTEVAALADRTPVFDIINTSPDQRTDEQRLLLRRFYLRRHDASYVSLLNRRDTARLKHVNEKEKTLTSMVMRERETPCRARMLKAGKYDRPGDHVTAGVPAVLPALPDEAPRNRLGLARWLVDPSHPLTARVAVNRYWQTFFGMGLAKTAEDFGVQGELPSHPELLDWLAVEFVDSGWDVKALHRLIVTSATYRQTSRVTEELLDCDPRNRLLARGPRFRLPAEMIRDATLCYGGLLADQAGGPGVMPYQPDGLWKELSFMSGHTAQVYEIGTGADLYRRSLYTFWKRTCPPPRLEIFDAPPRTTCQVRRSATNTPLQALVLMNDPTFLEAARALAQRALQAAPLEPVPYAFRRVLSRWPEARELARLRELWKQQRSRFQQHPERAAKLIRVGQSTPDPSLNAIDLAALTAVVHVLMSTDEAITRN